MGNVTEEIYEPSIPEFEQYNPKCPECGNTIKTEDEVGYPYGSHHRHHLRCAFNTTLRTCAKLQRRMNDFDLFMIGEFSSIIRNVKKFMNTKNGEL